MVTGQESTPEDVPLTGAAADLAEVNEAFYAAVESGDLDRMAAIWCDGADGKTSSCVHPGWPGLTGREEVLRSWALIMANTPYLQYFLTDLDITLFGDLAVVRCVENILTDVGNESDAFSSRLGGGRATAVNIFRLTPTGWRLWLHHASPVLAPAE